VPIKIELDVFGLEIMIDDIEGMQVVKSCATTGSENLCVR
jgi:hypothetical protein